MGPDPRWVVGVRAAHRQAGVHAAPAHNHDRRYGTEANVDVALPAPAGAAAYV